MNFGEYAASKLVPQAFREFLPFVSPAGLRVIHKEKVLSIALKSAAQTLNASSFDSAFQAIEATLARGHLKDRVRATRDSSDGIPIHEYLLRASEAERVHSGESILRLYFLMIQHPVPLFLDLRPSHFRWDASENKILWTPSRLWFERSDLFFNKVKALYKGFFDHEAASTRAGLELYAWESTPSDGFSDRIEVLMRRHFGDASSQSILFSMRHFKDTFHLVFEEAIKSQTRLHPELTFLGTTLAGLYLTLELHNVPLNVAQSYRATFSS